MTNPERIARDQRLRRAVLRGDETAWRAWYDESFDALTAYVVWRLGGRRHEADEIVQETWLVAVRSIRKFDPAAGSDEGAERRADESQRIARALDALPERYEAVLRAKYLEGMPVDKIAGQWTESAKAIESLLTRARQAFRQLYEQAGVAEENKQNSL